MAYLGLPEDKNAGKGISERKRKKPFEKSSI